MKLLCIWGETREDILKGYDAVGDSYPRITWRLVSAFDGVKVGDECFAPHHPEIRAAYGVEDFIPPIEEFAVELEAEAEDEAGEPED